MAKLRALLADDHPMILAGVRAALAVERDIEIAGEAMSGAQVMPLISRATPDVVLIDLRLPDIDGLTCLERIHKKYPNVKVIIFSAVEEPAQVARALQSGACAYVVKRIDPDDLAAVIRQAVAGSFFCFGGLDNGAKGNAQNNGGLSEREKEILGGVARGLSNRAIAKELWLSDQTVKFHLHNIYRKLDVGNRTEATKYAFDHGLVQVSAL